MSSMRNAVQRRNHKERSQPSERSKWGLLEKHKDYSLRAKDHNAKKRKLRALQEKASTRNEDEFYFGMMSNTSQGGRKVAKRGEENSGGGGKSLSVGTVKLMKTQDEGYLRTVLQTTRRQRGRVEREVLAQETGVAVAVPAPGAGRRKVFTEDGEDAAPTPLLPNGDDDDELDIDDLADLAGLDDLSDSGDEHEEVDSEPENLTPEQKTARRKRKHTLQVKKRLLEGLRDREEQLSTALREVEAQRARMNGGAGGVNKNGVRFKSRERKR